MISAVIPAYNEEKTVGIVVRKAKKYVDRVIVVDDGSKDRTSSVARKNGAHVITLKKNHGVGYATRVGMKAAIKEGTKIIITMDADGQHNPSDIPKFLRKINDGYEFVIGRRDLSNYPIIKRFGNFALNTFVNLISGTTIPDTESGFRAYKSSALKKLVLTADRYEICDEIIFEVGRNNLKWSSVPIESSVYKKGTRILDGLRIFRFMLRRRKRNLLSYYEDFKYVALKWTRKSRI